jgi:hypothetical protein
MQEHDYTKRKKTVYEKKIEYANWCISLLAIELGIKITQSYKLLNDSGLLDGLILKCYGTLHCMSDGWVVDELIKGLKVRGYL